MNELVTNFDLLFVVSLSLFLIAVVLFATNMIYAMPPFALAILVALWAFWIKQSEEITLKQHKTVKELHIEYEQY